jgi:hypothetical protein
VLFFRLLAQKRFKIWSLPQICRNERIQTKRFYNNLVLGLQTTRSAAHAAQQGLAERRIRLDTAAWPRVKVAGLSHFKTTTDSHILTARSQPSQYHFFGISSF